MMIIMMMMMLLMTMLSDDDDDDNNNNNNNNNNNLHFISKVTLTVFATYVLSNPDNHLTPQTAFVSLNLIQILNVSMTFLPIFIAIFAQVCDTVPFSGYVNNIYFTFR